MAVIVTTHTVNVQDVAGTNIETRSMPISVTVSQYQVHRIILANGVSEFVVSQVNLSNPGVILITATSLCRVNWSSVSSTGLASAGQNFKDLFAIAGSGISAFTGLHFANSSGDSAVVTLIIGM
jgi:hypothetical protein